MNLFKNILIFLVVSAALACSGNNPSNKAANSANNAANAANNSNANLNKAETDVYKDYPTEVDPKTVAGDDNSKNKKSTPPKPNSEKAEIKKTEPVSPSSDGASSVFKFRSSKTINSVAPRQMRVKRLPKVVVGNMPANQP